MANVTESSTWEGGIYRIETTDPILGGEAGTANMQAKQLANRTAYLKARADQVDAAAVGFGSLQAKLSSIEGQVAAVDVDMVNLQQAALKFALDQATQANTSIRSLHQHAQQEGEVTLTNRGLVSGGVITKFGTSRLLSIALGKCFINGRTYSIAAQQSLSVPEGGVASEVCYGYLALDASENLIFRVTQFGVDVPSNGIQVCSVTVPAGNTAADLTGVTVTAIARVEANYPISLDSPATASAMINIMDANDYRVDFDVVSFDGAPCDAKALVVTGRQTNGFTVTLASAADNVVVRWRASRLWLPGQSPLVDFVTGFHASNPTTY